MKRLQSSSTTKLRRGLRGRTRPLARTLRLYCQKEGVRSVVICVPATELGTEWRSETYRLKMRSFPDALGRSALEGPRRIPRRICGLPVAVPLLPPAAYRLLLELLWRDSSFCHLTVPYFHASGHVSLLVCDGGQSQEEKE